MFFIPGGIGDFGDNRNQLFMLVKAVIEGNRVEADTKIADIGEHSNRLNIVS